MNAKFFVTLQPQNRKLTKYYIMNINFQIHYRAEYGQSLCVIETQESILGWTEKAPLVLTCQGTDFWQVNVPVSDFAGSIQYKYAIRVGEGQYPTPCN